MALQNIQNKMKNIFSLKNKKGIFVGCSGLLGNILCKKLIDQGCRLHLFDIHPCSSSLKNKAESFFLGDASKRGDVQNFLTKVIQKEKKLDFLVYAPARSPKNRFEKRSAIELNSVWETNILGNINFLLEVFLLKKTQFGKNGFKIINFGSIYGLVSPKPKNYDGLNWCNSEIYGASKAAVIQLTKFFAAFGGEKNILINCLSPGGIRNPYQPQDRKFVQKYIENCPLNRMGRPEDMVGPIIFLLSDANTYITGHNLVADGGYTII